MTISTQPLPLAYLSNSNLEELINKIKYLIGNDLKKLKDNEVFEELKKILDYNEIESLGIKTEDDIKGLLEMAETQLKKDSHVEYTTNLQSKIIANDDATPVQIGINQVETVINLGQIVITQTVIDNKMVMGDTADSKPGVNEVIGKVKSTFNPKDEGSAGNEGMDANNIYDDKLIVDIEEINNDYKEGKVSAQHMKVVKSDNSSKNASYTLGKESGRDDWKIHALGEAAPVVEDTLNDITSDHDGVVGEGSNQDANSHKMFDTIGSDIRKERLSVIKNMDDRAFEQAENIIMQANQDYKNYLKHGSLTFPVVQQGTKGDEEIETKVLREARKELQRPGDVESKEKKLGKELDIGRETGAKLEIKESINRPLTQGKFQVAEEANLSPVNDKLGKGKEENKQGTYRDNETVPFGGGKAGANIKETNGFEVNRDEISTGIPEEKKQYYKLQNDDPEKIKTVLEEVYEGPFRAKRGIFFEDENYTIIGDKQKESPKDDSLENGKVIDIKLEKKLNLKEVECVFDEKKGKKTEDDYYQGLPANTATGGNINTNSRLKDRNGEVIVNNVTKKEEISGVKTSQLGDSVAGVALLDTQLAVEGNQFAGLVNQDTWVVETEVKPELPQQYSDANVDACLEWRIQEEEDRLKLSAPNLIVLNIHEKQEDIDNMQKTLQSQLKGEVPAKATLPEWLGTGSLDTQYPVLSNQKVETILLVQKGSEVLRNNTFSAEGSEPTQYEFNQYVQAQAFEQNIQLKPLDNNITSDPTLVTIPSLENYIEQNKSLEQQYNLYDSSFLIEYKDQNNDDFPTTGQTLACLGYIGELPGIDMNTLVTNTASLGSATFYATPYGLVKKTPNGFTYGTNNNLGRGEVKDLITDNTKTNILVVFDNALILLGKNLELILDPVFGNINDFDMDDLFTIATNDGLAYWDIDAWNYDTNTTGIRFNKIVRFGKSELYSIGNGYVWYRSNKGWEKLVRPTDITKIKKVRNEVVFVGTNNTWALDYNYNLRVIQ